MRGGGEGECEVEEREKTAAAHQTMAAAGTWLQVYITCSPFCPAPGLSQYQECSGHPLLPPPRLILFFAGICRRLNLHLIFTPVTVWRPTYPNPPCTPLTWLAGQGLEAGLLPMCSRQHLGTATANEVQTQVKGPGSRPTPYVEPGESYS